MEKAKAIKTLIAQDRIEEALETLADVYRESSFMREIILQKRRHQALMNENNQGIVSYGETALEKNKIAKAVLDLIDDIEQAEKAGPARRWWKLQAGRYRLLLLTIALLAVVAGGFVFYQHIEQQNNQEHIQWLDEEIAARIKRIDIPSWYRIALVKDSAIDLQKRLLLQPGDEMAIQERFKDRNLRSLLQELRDRVESLERENIELALEKLHEIEVKYNDGLLSDTNDPGHIVEFSSDLFELNAYRWIEHNQMDEKKYEEIVKSLNEILQEILEG